MRNACRINNDGSVSILLNLKDGGTVEAVVTAADYEAYAEPFGGTWIAFKHPRTGHLYARGGRWHNPDTGAFEQPMLHRLIAKPGKGEITAHINHNTLDCRPENMVNIPIGADIEDYINDIAIVIPPATPDNTNMQLVVTEGPKGNVVIKHEPVKDAIEPVKGVSFHKTKEKWEASPFYEGTRYRLGYWPRDQLAEANAAVTELRDIGPEAYFEKHPKKKGRK